MTYDERTFWEDRYQNGGNSGAGSSGEEGDFKVKTISNLIRRHSVKTLADLGCGDGQLAERISAQHKNLTYHGFDISPKAVELCEARMSDADDSTEFRVLDFTEEPVDCYDMVICLDVLFHLSSKDKHDAAVRTICQSFDKLAVVAAWNEKILDEYKKFAEHTFYRPFEPVEGARVYKVLEVPNNPVKNLYILKK